MASSRLPVPAPGPQLLIGERQGRWLRRSRRSAIAVPLAQRLPQSLGTWLALGFLTLSLGSGFVLGGHWQAMQDNYGEPRHMFARALGFGIDRVTISGLSGLSEQEVLVAAGIDSKTSLVFFDADEARKQLEATPLIREAAVRKLYPGEVSIQLTERELEILDKIAAGRNNAQIAQELYLAPKTVRNNVSTILAKLQATDRAEAIIRARDAGLGGS